ncbi:phage virion morphogenesis protein [Shinella sp. M31]|uniref:phage virion morphogenesis protein n=1 Tax=Shinella sp. M31 TaxID=3368615 RepID=UPI003BA3A765
MTGTAITLDDQDANDALSRLYAATGNIEPALKNIGEYEAKVTRARFISQTDPEGKAWKTLNELYAKTKKGPGILRGTTRDLSSIVYQLGADSVDIGSGAIHARIHNQGGKIVPKNAAALIFSMGGQTFKVKSVTIPRRQFVGWNETSIQEVKAIIEDHLEMAVTMKTASD